MSDAPRIVYRLRADVAPESERSALPAVYEFVLEASRKKEAAGPRQPDDLKDEKGKPKDDTLAQQKYTR